MQPLILNNVLFVDIKLKTIDKAERWQTIIRFDLKRKYLSDIIKKGQPITACL
jgi:hypothetical protein